MANAHPIHQRLVNGETLLIDGGTGTEIERRGAVMIENAWNAGGVLTHPDIVREVHEAYIQAGAQVIIANTFSSAKSVLNQVGMVDKFEFVNRRAVELAQEARSNQNAPHVAVAAGITTVVFKNGQMPSPDYAREAYAEQAAIYARAGVDLIILEMMHDVEYTLLALAGAKQTGVPVWVGISTRRNELGNNIETGVPGITVSDVVNAVQSEGADALLVMHTLTENVDDTLDLVTPVWQGPLGVYAHSGRFENPNWIFQGVISPEDYADHALRWVRRGSQIIGGCCGIGPEHIEVLQARLSAENLIAQSPQNQ